MATTTLRWFRGQHALASKTLVVCYPASYVAKPQVCAREHSRFISRRTRRVCFCNYQEGSEICKSRLSNLSKADLNDFRASGVCYHMEADRGRRAKPLSSTSLDLRYRTRCPRPFQTSLSGYHQGTMSSIWDRLTVQHKETDSHRVTNSHAAHCSDNDVYCLHRSIHFHRQYRRQQKQRQSTSAPPSTYGGR